MKRIKKPDDAPPRVRHLAQCTWTEERIAWSKALCKRFGFNRGDMFFQGHVYMLEFWDDLLSQITMGNHVTAYRVKSTHVIRDYAKRKNVNYIMMYIYGIFIRSDGLYIILYKDDEDDNSHDNIKQWFTKEHRLSEDIRDQFPTNLRKGIPD